MYCPFHLILDYLPCSRKYQFFTQACSIFSVLVLYTSRMVSSRDNTDTGRCKSQDSPEVLGRLCSDVRRLHRVPEHCSFGACGQHEPRVSASGWTDSVIFISTFMGQICFQKWDNWYRNTENKGKTEKTIQSCAEIGGPISMSLWDYF